MLVGERPYLPRLVNQLHQIVIDIHRLVSSDTAGCQRDVTVVCQRNTFLPKAS